MYGICLDDGAPEGFFKYMIADDYIPSKDIPEEFETVVIPEIHGQYFHVKDLCRKRYKK